MSKNKISKNWLTKQIRDLYVRKSQSEGYRSRAIYKLKEMDDKYNILKNGISLIDLGAAPGSWSQYAAKKIKKGKILSIDLLSMDKIENTFQIKGDFIEISLSHIVVETEPKPDLEKNYLSQISGITL